jgi:cystathionine beta-lyase
LDFGELVRADRVPSAPYRFLLQQAKVGLNPGAEFGPGAEHFVRLNFGCPRATLLSALQRIKASLSRA